METTSVLPGSLLQKPFSKKFFWFSFFVFILGNILIFWDMTASPLVFYRILFIIPLIIPSMLQVAVVTRLSKFFGSKDNSLSKTLLFIGALYFLAGFPVFFIPNFILYNELIDNYVLFVLLFALIGIVLAKRIYNFSWVNIMSLSLINVVVWAGVAFLVLMIEFSVGGGGPL